MISERLEEQAALYAAGALCERERKEFELLLEFHGELRAFVGELETVTVAATLAGQSNALQPSSELKSRLIAMIGERVASSLEQGFVMASPDGFVEWVNPAFTEMCGYTLDELRGQKLGPILQGPLTNRLPAARMREAVQTLQPCTEALVNYHKNGSPYWVSINITPLLDAAGEPLCIVAREVQLPERSLALLERYQS